jgi:hypothetical protein
MEGYGSDALTFADVQIFKPGGQALTVRELSGEVTAAQAEFGYNAAVIDGVLTLSLADFKNTTAGTNNNDTVSGVVGTLSGVWQVVSQKPFKSSLVAINAVPGVKSVGLSSSTLNMTFENVTANDGYYYDVTLERKSDADAPPLEALTIVKNAQVTKDSESLDLTKIEIADNVTYDIAEIASSGDWYPRVTLRTGKMESYTIGETAEQFLITEYVDDKICAEPYTVVNTTLASATWTPDLQTGSGGNQSIDVSFAPATAPTDMAVSGYHVTVYDDDANGLPASRRATDAEGSQRAALMEYDILTGEDDPELYEYNIPDVPTGKYTVGVSPMYADLIPETSDGEATGNYVASAVSRKGAEQKSGVITIVAATLPTLAFSVTGGALVEENGSKYVFAGEDAALTATALDNAAVTYCEFDGTELTDTSGTLTNLAAYSGRTLIVTARNAQGDSATEYLTVYADTTAPLLLPDNYDEGNGTFTFTAYKDTGEYTITGQAAPGAAIGGVLVGDDGRFSIPGKLDAGVNSEDFTLTATSAAGLVTMREIRVVRGNENESAGTPGTNGGSSNTGHTEPADEIKDAAPAESPIANPFTDINESAWYYDDVMFAYTRSLMVGTTANRFSPNMSMTRGMIVTVLGRLHGIDTSEFTGSTFSDVDANAYYAAYVEWARTVGVVNGVGNNNFAPEASVSRQDLAVILDRYADWAGSKPPVARDYSGFKDEADIANYAKEAIERFFKAGIINGKDNNLFDPKGQATRAEVAAMLHRFILAAEGARD